MDKIWLNSYPPGVPGTVNCETFQTLSESLLSYCKQFSKNIAFTGVGGDLTFEELEVKSCYLAAAWQADGLRKGDKIAFILPNILHYPISFLAAIRIGLVVVNVNPMYTEREIQHQLSDSETKAVVVLDLCSQEFSKSAVHLSVQHVYVTSIGDSMSWPLRNMVNVISRIKKNSSMRALPKKIPVRSLREKIKKGKSLTLKPVILLPDDVILLQYTSATTGVAKGAMITNKNMLANMMQLLTWIRSTLIVGKEVVLGALPLYHIYALMVCGLCFMSIGSRVVLVPNPRDIKKLIKLLHKIPMTVVVGLNTLFQTLLNQPNFPYCNFSQLKLTVAGGMPTKSPVAEEWKKMTGISILDAYGLTEASPVVTANPITATDFNGSVGLPLPNTEVKIVDSNGLAVCPGKVGEMYVRGPQVMLGYWKNPEATAEVLDSDGWLKTGDIARMDEQGFIYIVDRKKDMILVSGFNVYPNEVEDVLNENEKIIEAAVIGVDDSKSGEVVIAYVVVKDEKITEEEIKAYCRTHLAAYKIPKRIFIVKDLPKSNVGKVLRRELKERYRAG
jgi:long-chain acyl-CoA synthetase